MKKIFKGFFMEQLRWLFKKELLNIERNKFEALLTVIGFKKWNVEHRSMSEV